MYLPTVSLRRLKFNCLERNCSELKRIDSMARFFLEVGEAQGVQTTVLHAPTIGFIFRLILLTILFPVMGRPQIKV
jgi:hypothetical protein